MRVNRRTFLVLGAAFAAGCATQSGGVYLSAGNVGRVVNAGPSAQYLADGVYTRYSNSGFFIVRRGPKLFALSAICTHRKCRLKTDPDKAFYCPCHGSTFDVDGKVTEGPATRDLAEFSVSTNEKGDLLVALQTI